MGLQGRGPAFGKGMIRERRRMAFSGAILGFGRMAIVIAVIS
jgi:hypothetical protein